MGAVLTAGGRRVDQLQQERSQARVLAEWDRAVTELLRYAAASKPGRDRMEKMQAWLRNEENQWHEKYSERYDQYWVEKQRDCEIASKMFDMTIQISRMEREFDDATVRGMSALLGCPMYPHVSQQFALWAQKIGSDDVFEVVRAWQMSEYVADKEAEQAMRDPIDCRVIPVEPMPRERREVSA